MHPVQQHLMDTDFAGLNGTEIEGTVALSDELINLGIMEVLAKLKSAGQPKPVKATTEAAGTRKAGEPEMDPQQLLQKLRVDEFTYRTEQGKTMLDFKAGFG